jgi:hypothetical protein
MIHYCLTSSILRSFLGLRTAALGWVHWIQNEVTAATRFKKLAMQLTVTVIELLNSVPSIIQPHSSVKALLATVLPKSLDNNTPHLLWRVPTESRSNTEKSAPVIRRGLLFLDNMTKDNDVLQFTSDTIQLPDIFWVRWFGSDFDAFHFRKTRKQYNHNFAPLRIENRTNKFGPSRVPCTYKAILPTCRAWLLARATEVHVDTSNCDDILVCIFANVMSQLFQKIGSARDGSRTPYCVLQQYERELVGPRAFQDLNFGAYFSRAQVCRPSVRAWEDNIRGLFPDHTATHNNDTQGWNSFPGHSQWKALVDWTQNTPELTSTLRETVLKACSHFKWFFVLHSSRLHVYDYEEEWAQYPPLTSQELASRLGRRGIRLYLNPHYFANAREAEISWIDNEAPVLEENTTVPDVEPSRIRVQNPPPRLPEDLEADIIATGAAERRPRARLTLEETQQRVADRVGFNRNAAHLLQEEEESSEEEQQGRASQLRGAPAGSREEFMPGDEDDDEEEEEEAAIRPPTTTQQLQSRTLQQRGRAPQSRGAPPVGQDEFMPGDEDEDEEEEEEAATRPPTTIPQLQSRASQLRSRTPRPRARVPQSRSTPPGGWGEFRPGDEDSDDEVEIVADNIVRGPQTMPRSSEYGVQEFSPGGLSDSDDEVEIVADNRTRHRSGPPPKRRRVQVGQGSSSQQSRRRR